MPHWPECSAPVNAGPLSVTTEKTYQFCSHSSNLNWTNDTCRTVVPINTIANVTLVASLTCNAYHGAYNVSLERMDIRERVHVWQWFEGLWGLRNYRVSQRISFHFRPKMVTCVFYNSTCTFGNNVSNQWTMNTSLCVAVLKLPKIQSLWTNQVGVQRNT